MVKVPAGLHRSPFPASGKSTANPVKPFRMDVRPVTAAEFSAFIQANPAWSRTRVKRLFADSTYLADWGPDLSPPPGTERRAVTRVSWYAAKAYCQDRGKRLPTTSEWERAALEVPEGVDSAGYFSRILEWYSRPASLDSRSGDMPGSRNAFGLRDLFGNAWEWTADFNVGGPTDRGEGSAKNASFFCGGAAGAASPGTDYATFIRYAFRSSLKPEFTLSSLGFRCAQDL